MKIGSALLEGVFHLSEHRTSVRTELVAGLTTFLTMAYIIFVQPAVLSGALFNSPTGMDFGALTTATCAIAALATAIMALYARYPIAQAPGMGENFFFVLSVIPAATAAGFSNAWEVALGVVFVSGLLFLLLSVVGVREMLLNAISSSMKNGIAVGIGLFIAFIGLQNTGLILKHPATAVTLNANLASPDLVVFFFGFLLTAGLYARRIPGAMVWGIVGATLFATALRLSVSHLPSFIAASQAVTDSMLWNRFTISPQIVSLPPSLSPLFLKMDVWHAVSIAMLPFVVIFLFMDLFDTLGTLIGVSEQAGLVQDNRLPRANRVLVSDAVGTVLGACVGTSTVTSFIESAAGVEQGGRTGLTSLTTAALFLLALFFGPLIAMVGSYPPITAPALVIVGAMMLRNALKIDWSDYSESIPAFLIMIGIPLSYSIADGLALGFISYPIIKIIGGKGRDVTWLMRVLALILVVYFVWVRSRMS